MEQVAADPDRTYTREEYHAWCETQVRGRFERVDGRIVAMAPERLSHVRVKGAVYLELRRAVLAAGIDCETLTDGVAVQVDDSDYGPDATISCGPVDGDQVWVPNPVVLVEVLSPSTATTDTGIKLRDYFRIPSVEHYLIVHVNRRLVVHHKRATDGIATAIVARGSIDMEPPGISVTVDAFYQD